MKSVLNMRSIEGMVHDSIEFGYDKSGYDFDPADKESIIRYANEGLSKSKEHTFQMMNLLGQMAYSMNLSQNCFDFYKFLRGNVLAQEKIRFIDDGSFYQVRLWSKGCNNELQLYIEFPYGELKEIEGMSFTERLEKMFMEYEYIPVQIPIWALENMSKFKTYMEFEEIDSYYEDGMDY